MSSNPRKWVFVNEAFLSKLLTCGYAQWHISQLKGHALCTAKTRDSVKRFHRFITWLPALVSLGIWCKVTAVEALSSQSWLLILQWELESMSSRSSEVLRQCPGTGRYEKLVCKAGLRGASQNHPLVQ